MTTDQPRRTGPTSRLRGAAKGLAVLLATPLLLYALWTLQVIVAPPLYGLLDALPIPGYVAGVDVMERSAELHHEFTSGVLALVAPTEAASATDSEDDTPLAPTDSEASASMTWDEWVIYSNNGVLERRTRFEQFSPPPTPASVVHDFVAYLDREIERTEDIVPDDCWADMHTAYLDIIHNDHAMLGHILDGEMPQAEGLLAKTGELNYALTRQQRSASSACDPSGEHTSLEPPTTATITPRPTPAALPASTSLLDPLERAQMTLMIPPSFVTGLTRRPPVLGSMGFRLASTPSARRRRRSSGAPGRMRRTTARNCDPRGRTRAACLS